MKTLRVLMLALLLIAVPGLVACGGSSSPTDPGPPVATQCSDGVDNDGDGLVDMADPGCENPEDNDESDDPDDGDPTDSTLEFVSANPPCGETAVANPLSGVKFSVNYENTASEPASVAVRLYDASGTLVGGGSNHRKLAAGSSGTAIADASADNPGVTSTRVVITLDGFNSFEELDRTEVACTHHWE